MDGYLTTQRSTIFQHVGVMIYVFDVETAEMNKDLEYYRDCLEGLRTYSKDLEAGIFLLVHKRFRGIRYYRKVSMLNHRINLDP